MKKFLTLSLILRVGLACVFLTNSITAFTDPAEFIDLLSGSVVTGLLPVSVPAFITFVGYHDLLIAVLLLAGWQTTLVAIYATLWITSVTCIIGFITLDGLEHIGYISSALALALRKKLPID